MPFPFSWWRQTHDKSLIGIYAESGSLKASASQKGSNVQMTLGYLEKILHLVLREIQLSLDIQRCILMLICLVEWVIRDEGKTSDG